MTSIHALMCRAAFFKNFMTVAVLCIGLHTGKADVQADTYTTPCTQELVADAISGAEDGDTIRVQAGECTWASTLTITKGINLIGNGVDSTTIINNVPAAQGTSGQPLVRIDVDGREPWRVSGFTFTDTGTNYDWDGIFTIRGSVTGWQIDNCKFVDLNYRAMKIYGEPHGLIHSNTFNNIGNNSIYIQPVHSDALWATPTTLGGIDAIYVEDNVFQNDGRTRSACDGEYGSKVVFRHNTCINTNVLSHGYEHDRSTIRLEVYNNTFTATGEEMENTSTIVYRGGTGVIFNNTIVGNWWHPLMYYDYCVCGTGPVCHHEECTAYPCPDQVGRTYNQIASPIYQWNNTYQGNPVTSYVFDNCSDQSFSVADIIQAGRDYHDNLEHPTFQALAYPHPLRSTSGTGPGGDPGSTGGSKGSGGCFLSSIFLSTIR